MRQEHTENVLWYSDRARRDKAMFAEIPQSAWRQFHHRAFQSLEGRKAGEAIEPRKTDGGGHKYPCFRTRAGRF